MPAEDKKRMLDMLGRCSDVIDGEMGLLDDWAQATTLPGRAERCVKRRARIRSGPRSRMDGILAAAKALLPDNVVRPPDHFHESIVRPNEKSLSVRQGWKVDKLSDPMFTRALDRSEENSADSVKDAQTILRDCT